MPAPVITRLAGLLGRKLGAAPALLKQDVLVKLIVGRDRIPYPPRIHPKGFIHVSGLVRGDCPRMMSLARKFKVYKDTNVNGATRLMWEIGRKVEQHVRAQLIAALPPNQVYGVWKCPCQKRVREGIAKDDNTCHRCGFPAMDYYELDLEDENYYVTGHPDLILIFNARLYPVEIKSLGNSKSANAKGEGFDTITKPFVNHALQVSSYHRMLTPLSKRLGLPLGESALILYASKDFNGFKSPYPYKEYHLTPYDYKQFIQQMFVEARAAYMGVHNTLPPRLNACSSAGTKCALGCPLAHHCFALPSTAAIK